MDNPLTRIRENHVKSPNVKIKDFCETDDARIFKNTFENFTVGLDDCLKANNLIVALNQGVLDCIKGELKCEWTFKNLQKIFLKRIY